MVRVFVVAAILVGCYRPTPPQGVPCTTSDECPDPLSCSGGACVLQPIDAAVDTVDADLDCTCSGNNLVCPDNTTTCPAGCTLDNGPRCLGVVPSNAVVGDFPATPTVITIAGVATFNTDTGFVNGVVARPAGVGVKNSIGYDKATTMGANLGVFSFSALAVTSTGVIHFVGCEPREGGGSRGRNGGGMVETDNDLTMCAGTMNLFCMVTHTRGHLEPEDKEPARALCKTVAYVGPG